MRDDDTGDEGQLHQVARKRPMRPLRDKVAEWFGVFAVGLFFIAFCQSLSFYAIGARSPQPSLHKTFPIALHGTVYVEPRLGEMFYGTLALSFLCFLAWAALVYGRNLPRWRGRR